MLGLAAYSKPFQRVYLSRNTGSTAPANHDRTSLDEGRVPADMVQVMVRVDHESHRQRRDRANDGEACRAASVPRFPSASTLMDASMTATPSSPMTNPAFAGAGALDLGVDIAAQTFGPTFCT